MTDAIFKQPCSAEEILSVLFVSFMWKIVLEHKSMFGALMCLLSVCILTSAGEPFSTDLMMGTLFLSSRVKP